jgi:hypothetical protein
VEQFKQAIVYGKSVKHQPQRVGLSHELADEDISEYQVIVFMARALTEFSSHHHQALSQVDGGGS